MHVIFFRVYEYDICLFCSFRMVFCPDHKLQPCSSGNLFCPDRKGRGVLAFVELWGGVQANAGVISSGSLMDPLSGREGKTSGGSMDQAHRGQNLLGHFATDCCAVLYGA